MNERDDTNTAAEPSAPDLGKALSMATEIFAAARGAVPSSQSSQHEAAHAGEHNGDPPSNEELAAMLAKLLVSSSPQNAGADAGSQDTAQAAASDSAQADPADSGLGLGGIAAALPMLMQAMSGGGTFIKPEKLNLIKALRPYMSDTRGGSIERAIKMANVAQAAKSALTALGR